MLKLLLLGYGRMGKMIEAVAVERGHRIGVAVGREDTVDEGAWRACDVAIDFSAPASAESLCRSALGFGIPVVSGTTGWPAAPLSAEVQRGDYTAGFLHGTNMSIGVNAVFAANELLAKLLAKSATVEASIDETHHVHKLDAPSGTAITLAEATVAGLPSYTSYALDANRPNELSITAHREGEVYGIHEVRYRTPVDVVTLRHEATSRRGFAEGAVLAAEYLAGRTGVHTMRDVLFSE